MTLKILSVITSLVILAGCQHNPNSPNTVVEPSHASMGALPDIRSLGPNHSNFSHTNYFQSRQRVEAMEKQGELQILNEGQRITLILPTDKYFVLDSDELDYRKSGALANIAELIACFPSSDIFVAGFTDDIGSEKHKKSISQRRAQTIAAYLWSHGINQRTLHTSGYGDKFPISDNRLIHGSSQNRRIEIQWTVC